MEKSIKKIIEAAESGGKILTKHFGKSLEIQQKTKASDFRTKADLESEKEILRVLKKNFPTYNFISEEDGETDNGSDYTFIIDPLDGTNNFVLGIPNFSISIGLIHKNVPIAGVIHAPVQRQMFYAQKNRGAYLNDTRLHVSSENNLTASTIGYARGYNIKDKCYFSDLILYAEKNNIKRIINSWSPAYDFCLLASGKIEAMINNNNEFYDFAAGKLLAKEAGAIITDFSGRKEKSFENPEFIASNCRAIHTKLVSFLK